MDVKNNWKVTFYVKTGLNLLDVFMQITHKFTMKKPIFVVFMWFMT